MKDILNLLLSDAGMMVSNAIQLICTALLILFMHFSAKYRNYKLSIGWYIAAFFFPLITVFVFLSKRKKFPGPKMKVCPVCGDKYPEVYQVCGRCLIELPENKAEEKEKENRTAKIFGWTFGVIYGAASVLTVAVAVMTCMYIFQSVGSLDDIMSDSYRIACVNENGEKVYYDKEGNSYEKGTDVLIYGKKGEAYTYELIDEIEENGTYASYYINEDGERFDSINCYVDEDGYFFYDEEAMLFYNDNPDAPYAEEDSDEEDSESFTDMIDLFMDEILGIADYKYYLGFYIDEDGNKYYWAEEASWNEKGELITAENDPNPLTE